MWIGEVDINRKFTVAVFLGGGGRGYLNIEKNQEYHLIADGKKYYLSWPAYKSKNTE